MIKIEEFIKQIQDDNISVSSLLRQAKLLAKELDQSDFLEWLSLEIEGYKKDDDYPEYRMLNGVMKAWNPYRGWIPVMHDSSDFEEKISKRGAKQSIREVEELISSKSNNYEMPYPSSINKIIKGSFETKISLFIDRSALVGLLDAVRNKLLDWASELQSSGIHGDEAEFTKDEKDKAQKVEANLNIGKIENFHGNFAEDNNHTNEIIIPTESIGSKVFWYIGVALGVVVVGNILSSLILKNVFGI